MNTALFQQELKKEVFLLSIALVVAYTIVSSVARLSAKHQDGWISNVINLTQLKYYLILIEYL
jgi:hypothetical protein